jgi:cyclophilin family peptidyl-prolyl cis-trans isomerase
VFRPLALLLCLLCFAVTACGGDDDDGDSAGGGDGTAAAEQSGPKPRKALDPGRTYDVALETSCGAITIRLDQKTSPKTAASFASLARSGFYDDTVFHRIVPGFVIQGGDPTASGSGGPGYSVRDVPPADTSYTEGVVAMAKTAVEPPGTAGSQFYIVTAPDAGLPPEYGLLGKVVKGLEVARAIDKLGDPASGEAGTPLRPVVIEKASVNES